jgi:hypothetical protein
MSKTRQTSSRAKEFDLMFGSLGDPQALAFQISNSPKGGVAVLEGIKFEFGNVDRLVKYIEPKFCVNPFGVKPIFICHLDGLGAQRKKAIENEYDLKVGSISSKRTKADLFMVDESGKKYFISVKDGDSESKLGQISTPMSYGSAYLNGGINFLKPEGIMVPKIILVGDTGLSEEQFQKIGAQDRYFAFIKEKYPVVWKELVDKSEELALEEIRQFGSTLNKDKNSFISFIGQTIAGNLSNSDDFFLLVGNKVIQLSKALDFLKSAETAIYSEEYKPRKKTSLIIWIEMKNEKYCLMKIESSFEGKKSSVSQTKGIIYHFQQHLKVGNNFKQLLLDVSQ